MMDGIRKIFWTVNSSGFKTDLKLEGEQLWKTLEILFKK